MHLQAGERVIGFMERMIGRREKVILGGVKVGEIHSRFGPISFEFVGWESTTNIHLLTQLLKLEPLTDAEVGPCKVWKCGVSPTGSTDAEMVSKIVMMRFGHIRDTVYLRTRPLKRWLYGESSTKSGGCSRGP